LPGFVFDGVLNNMIVMKFGGTSVEDTTAIRRLIEIVRRERDRKPLIVVSAMGRTTNGLLSCAHLAGDTRIEEARSAIDAIAAHHIDTARQLVREPEIDSVVTGLRELFDLARSFLEEIASDAKVSPRLSDAVSATGELASSLIVSAAVRAAGMPGVWVDIRPLVRTSGDFTRAAVDFESSNEALRVNLSAMMAEGRIPVVQGFIGSAPDGSTTTIGRGGSDYSAAIIGAALDAGAIDIWTDVDGILTTDPRVVPGAARVRTISFAEAAELAYFGAKVLHPSTLLPAMKKDIPVHVRNSRRPEGEGTQVVQHAPASKNLVRAIAFKRGITVINVSSYRMLMAYGFLARLFEIFARHQTAVDMVSTSEVSVSMTLDDASNLEKIIPEIEVLGEVAVERNQALVSLVGEGLKFTPGVAARIFSSIDQINVSMISHGASAINVSFIVAGDRVEDAVKALHSEFFGQIDREAFEQTEAALQR
jgi:aspartate kinase